MDIKIKYSPHPKQQIAHSSPERYILYGGSFRGGKSVFLVNEVIQFHQKILQTYILKVMVVGIEKLVVIVLV